MLEETGRRLMTDELGQVRIKRRNCRVHRVEMPRCARDNIHAKLLAELVDEKVVRTFQRIWRESDDNFMMD